MSVASLSVSLNINSIYNGIPTCVGKSNRTRSNFKALFVGRPIDLLTQTYNLDMSLSKKKMLNV